MIKGEGKPPDAREVQTHKEYRLPRLDDVDLSARRITVETCRRYKVGEDELQTYVYFPYYSEDGVLYGAKVRRQEDWTAKHYHYEGNTLPFFGLHTIKAHHKRLLIVEGELDALAASQMYGMKYAVISVANGAKGAVKNFKDSVKFLNRFDEVVICFDNDDVGREKLEELKKYVKPGRLRIVYNWDIHEEKDACDFLRNGKDREFREVIDNALKIKPAGIVDKEDLFRRVMADLTGTDERAGYRPTGFAGFDKAIGGFRAGELITLAASTGVGKTTLALQLILRALDQGLKVMVFSLETSDIDVVKKLIEMKYNVKTITSKDYIKFEPEEVEEKVRTFTENLTFHENLGSIDIKDLKEEIEYTAMAGLADIIILDHITAAAQIEKGSNQVQHIDAMMNVLNQLTAHYRLWTLVITHVSRDNDDKARKFITLNHIRFSEGIAQYSHCVIGVTRPMQDNYITCTMLKGHRKFGRFADFMMVFDEETQNYYDCDNYGKPIGKETSVQRNEKKQVSCDKVSIERRQDKVRQQTGEGSTRTESEADTGAEEATVQHDIQTGLRTEDEDGKADIHRSEGDVYNEGQSEDGSGEESEPVPRHTALAFVTQSARKSPLREWAKHGGMGNRKGFYLG